MAVRIDARTPMNGGEGHSVTGWLGELKEGDQAAAQPLWERYFSKLVVVARAKLRRLRPTRPTRTRKTPPSARSIASAAAPPGQVSPARGPRRPLAAAGRDHGAQGDGPGQAQGSPEARRRPGGHRGGSLRPRGRRERGLDGRTGADRRRRPNSGVRRDDGRGVPKTARRARGRLAPPGRLSAGWRDTTTTRSPTSSAAPAAPSPGGST